MKKTLLISVFLLLSAGLAAQTGQYSIEYGNVNNHELTETGYPLDPEAEAAVIYENGFYRFMPYERNDRKGLELEMRIRSKIKIYNDAGLRYATIEIPYYEGGTPETVGIVGKTYNYENGNVTVTEITRANIYDENAGNGYFVRKIAFPDVRAGSVIEFEYIIKSPNIGGMRRWMFQKKIPVYYSKLIYKATPFYNYAFIAKGVKKFDEYTSEIDNTFVQFDRHTYQEIEHTFIMNRMPAFRDEEFLYNVNDYMANIDFQLSDHYSLRDGTKTAVITTWPSLCRDLLKDADFGKYMDASQKEAKKILPQLGLDGKTDLEKFRIICEYVKGMYSWDGSQGKYARRKLPAFLKEKTGNSAELNLFMVGLMKAAGLEAYPVGLSTRANGFIYKNYPFSRSLNYVVAMAKIDGNNYFADATLTLTRYDQVAMRCTNVEGLVIWDKAPQWVEVRQNENSAEHKTIRMTVSPGDGKIYADMEQELRGYQASQSRSNYNGNTDGLKDMYRECEGMNISDLSVENFNDTAEPFIIKMKYDITTGPAGDDPDKIYITPLLYMAVSENPFKQAKRTHPVDLAVSEVNSYEIEIEIPEGYKVEYLPERLEKKNNLMHILYTANADGNKIKINASYTLKNYYDAMNYLPLKKLYDEMIRSFTDVIILTKTV